MSLRSILVDEFSSSSMVYCAMVDSLEIGQTIKTQKVEAPKKPKQRSIRFSDVVSVDNSAVTMTVNGDRGGQVQAAYNQNT
ncbi:hypothetical protein CLU79DRAFT_772252 [Phycomyces nitens]|nr:hypothetical protein CLU79DRAFT_772251 [Phycomyces nitens]KAI9011002.1 hypothetical protein CLU79DRAFT_772252 [Phycomyces nitens]